MFDIQYADGLSRPDTTISVFDQNGNLLLIGRDSQVPDDQKASGSNGANVDHGSFGTLDAFIGPVQVPAGGPQPADSAAPPVGGTGGRRYYIAVSSSAMLPTILDATFKMDATNPKVRLEPINSVARIADDRIGSTGSTTADASKQIFPGTSPIELNVGATPYTLADVVLFLNTSDDLYTVNPFTGQMTTFVTRPNVANEFLGQASPTSKLGYLDMAMRDDGRMYSMSRGFGDNNTATTNGTFMQFDPATRTR